MGQALCMTGARGEGEAEESWRRIASKVGQGRVVRVGVCVGQQVPTPPPLSASTPLLVSLPCPPETLVFTSCDTGV